MGKKDKTKKKGKGAEKTAEKTAKKLVAKLKKETGEVNKGLTDLVATNIILAEFVVSNFTLIILNILVILLNLHDISNIAKKNKYEDKRHQGLNVHENMYISLFIGNMSCCRRDKKQQQSLSVIHL